MQEFSFSPQGISLNTNHSDANVIDRLIPQGLKKSRTYSCSEDLLSS